MYNNDIPCDLSGSLVPTSIMNNNNMKNSNSNSNSNLMDILKSTLPLIILGSKEKSLSELIFLPIISFLIIKLFDYMPLILNKLYYLIKFNKLIDKINNFNKKYQFEITKGNPLYIQMDKYIIDNYNSSINSYKSPNNITGMTNLEYEFDHFNYCNEDIEILKVENKYIIQSDKKQNISKLIDQVKSHYKEYLDEITNTQISIFDWNNKNSSFEAKKIVHCNKNINNVFLSKENSKLIDFVSHFKENKNSYTKLGLPHKLGILMYGKPGCGKSSTIYAIAELYNKKLYKLNLKKIKTKREFDLIREKIPKNSIIIMEDVDCMSCLNKRTESKKDKFLELKDEVFKIDTENILNESVSQININNISLKKNGSYEVISYYQLIDVINQDCLNLVESYRNMIDFRSQVIIDNIKKVMNEEEQISMDDILEFLDGYHDLQDCIVIMTTNHKELLDDAVIRHGRMDLHMEFKLCNSYQFNNIFEYYVGKKVWDINKNFKFPENKYSTAKIINEFILPNLNEPEIILSTLNNNNLD